MLHPLIFATASAPVGAKCTETNAAMASSPFLDIDPGQAFAKNVVIGPPQTTDNDAQNLELPPPLLP